MEAKFIYLVMEVYEDNYELTDGYVNSVYLDYESAAAAKTYLEKFMEGKPYTCKIIKREILG